MVFMAHWEVVGALVNQNGITMGFIMPIMCSEHSPRIIWFIHANLMISSPQIHFQNNVPHVTHQKVLL